MYKDWVGVITIVKRNIWFQLDGGMGFYVVVTERDGFMRADPYWGVGVSEIYLFIVIIMQINLLPNRCPVLEFGPN